MNTRQQELRKLLWGLKLSVLCARVSRLEAEAGQTAPANDDKEPN